MCILTLIAIYKKQVIQILEGTYNQFCDSYVELPSNDFKRLELYGKAILVFVFLTKGIGRCVWKTAFAEIGIL